MVKSICSCATAGVKSSRGGWDLRGLEIWNSLGGQIYPANLTTCQDSLRFILTYQHSVGSLGSSLDGNSFGFTKVQLDCNFEVGSSLNRERKVLSMWDRR